MEREVSYKQLLMAYRQLENENQAVKKMLSSEKISELSVLVKECVKYNRNQLRKVAMELQLTKYDSRNVEEIATLINFLSKMCEELNIMIKAGV